jgi:hypothetical protein
MATPKLVKEISQGSGATLSKQGGGVEYTRVFKVLLYEPNDVQEIDWIGAITSVDPQFLGVGSPYPWDNFASCATVAAAPDGDSRLAYTVTATYQPLDKLALEQGGANDQNPDPGQQPPDLRPANWSTTTSTIEVPSWWWVPRWGNNNGQAVPAFNPAGDMVDGLTILQPIVNISVEQYCAGDQTVFSEAVGKVNSNQGRLGSLNLFPRSVLFRSVSFRPHAETFGNKKWRGWLGTFEFSYKPNFNNYLKEYLGWDIAMPLSGYNIRNSFGADVDKGACHLVLENELTGAIKNWPNPAIEPTLANKKVRANVLISVPTENGTRAAQRPSAMPVPLNENGTPRDPDANPPVLLRRYSLYEEFDMSTLGLRFR